MKCSVLINVQMQQKLAFSYLLAKNFSSSAIFSKKEFAVVVVILDLLAGQISCPAELNTKKVL